MNLTLNLYGEFCNSWPILTVIQKNKKQEYEIQKNTVLTFELSNSPFSMGMYNKSFGKNRIWDTTTDSKGNILSDKLIRIDSIYLEDVEISHLLERLDFKSEEQGIITVYDKCLRFNGHWNFDVRENPYDWIIETNSQRSNEYRDTSYFSDYTILNNYSEHFHHIDKIRKLLNI